MANLGVVYYFFALYGLKTCTDEKFALYLQRIRMRFLPSITAMLCPLC